MQISPQNVYFQCQEGDVTKPVLFWKRACLNLFKVMPVSGNILQDVNS